MRSGLSARHRTTHCGNMPRLECRYKKTRHGDSGMRKAKVLAALAAGLVLAGHDGAGAQSFDCAQGRTAVEKAVWASPALREMDAPLARSYQGVLGLDP